MSELKTLKDLKWLDASDFGILEDNDTVLVSELKAEAVKWVKDLRQQLRPENLEFREWRAGNYAQEEFIKHFFNLTEDDLKQGEEE